MKKNWFILSLFFLLLLSSCSNYQWIDHLLIKSQVPPLGISGLEGIPQPESKMLLEGIVSFSRIEQNTFTGQEFIVGFDKDKTPRLIALHDQKKNSWLWKIIGLRDLANPAGLEIGSEIEGLMYSDPRFFNIINKEFNMGTLHTCFYWTGSEVKQGFFNYSSIDINLSHINELITQPVFLLRGHPLVWYFLLPKWLTEGNFTRDELITVVQDHITHLVKKYKDSIKEWVVVNEPFHGDDLFYRTIGEEYIDISFQSARQADPSAVLIMNDYDNETTNGKNTQQSVEIIDHLKKKGLVDGVGLQMHLNGAHTPTKEDMIRTMQRYGVPVYITELDVDLSDVPISQPERFELQARVYGDVMAACLDSGVCRSFTMWGIGDKYSWLERDQKRQNADSTIFDDDLNPKPAYYTLLRILADHLGATPNYSYP